MVYAVLSIVNVKAKRPLPLLHTLAYLNIQSNGLLSLSKGVGLKPKGVFSQPHMYKLEEAKPFESYLTYEHFCLTGASRALLIPLLAIQIDSTRIVKSS